MHPSDVMHPAQPVYLLHHASSYCKLAASIECVLFPFQEVHDARIDMQRRTNEWYQGLRAISSDDDELHVAPGTSKLVGANLMETNLMGTLRERTHSPSTSPGSVDITADVASPPLL